MKGLVFLNNKFLHFRYLLKVFSASTGSEKLSSSNLYMRDRPVIHAIHDASDCLNPKVLAAVLKTRACL